MSTALIVIGILGLIVMVYVDFRVVNWILGGGLNTFRRKLLLVYLPLALWFVCGAVVYFFATTAGFGETGIFPWLRRFHLLWGGFYGLGFMLYILVSPKSGFIHWLLGGGLILMALALIVNNLGLRFNLTPSMPMGLYLMRPAAERPERGDLVTFCLESDHPFTEVARERDYVGSGTCPSGLKPFLKVLAGLPGDMVEASPDGIILGGSWLAGTARPEYDSQGRPAPPSLLQDGPIPDGQALVISQRHGGSFDSRHFGLVPLDSLTKVTPVLTDYSPNK